MSLPSASSMVLAGRQSLVHPVHGSLRAMRVRREGRTTPWDRVKLDEGISERERQRANIEETNHTFIKSSLLLTILRIHRKCDRACCPLSACPLHLTFRISEQKSTREEQCSCRSLPTFTCCVVWRPKISAPSAPNPTYHISRPSPPMPAFPVLF